MKSYCQFFFLFFLLFLAQAVQADNLLANPGKDRVTVYLFLGEECIISQQFTLLINRLHAEHQSDHLSFSGLFPNPSSNPDKIAVFKDKYEMAFEMKQDAMQHKMDQFGVRVTPEVVVYNHVKKEVLYQGRIDNTFFRVGKRRTVTTTSELEDVLISIKKGEEILVKKTEAVGCFITPLDASLKNLPMCDPKDKQ